MEDDVDEVSTQVIYLHSLIPKGDIRQVKEALNLVGKEQRKILVNAKLDGNTALFVACHHRKLDIIRYLIEQCEADTELTGIHVVKEDDDSKHIVPPVWSAAIRNDIDIANLLLDLGANVNGSSDTASTAVRAACYGNHLEMVKLLVGRGADINIPNVNGATCLMNAIESVDLCEFLLKQGANVNTQETGRDHLTSLHYAINYKNIDSIRILIAHGADVNIKTREGISPIVLAALLNLKFIVEFFMKNCGSIPTEEKINAVELLGTKLVDYSKYSQAITQWKTGVSLREQYNLAKKLSNPREIFGNIKEFSTLEELDNMLPMYNDLKLQSFLVKERILGPFNPDVSMSALQYAMELRDAGNYNQSLSIVLLCYGNFLKTSCVLFDNCIITVSQVINLFHLQYSQFEVGNSEIISQTKDTSEMMNLKKTVVSFFDKLVLHIKEATLKLEAKLGERQIGKDDRRNYLQLLLLGLDTIMIAHSISKSPLEKSFYLSVAKLVQQDPRSAEQETLLHIAASRSRGSFQRLYESLPPFSEEDEIQAVKTLIECGADVNAVDSQGYTPLHTNIHYSLIELSVNEGDILNVLLRNGAHLDMQSCYGASPVQLAKQINADIRVGKYTTLKCLAARTIVDFKIPFQYEIPQSLVHFVRLHERPGIVPMKRVTGI